MWSYGFIKKKVPSVCWFQCPMPFQECSSCSIFFCLCKDKLMVDSIAFLQYLYLSNCNSRHQKVYVTCISSWKEIKLYLIFSICSSLPRSSACWCEGYSKWWKIVFVGLSYNYTICQQLDMEGFLRTYTYVRTYIHTYIPHNVIFNDNGWSNNLFRRRSTLHCSPASPASVVSQSKHICTSRSSNSWHALGEMDVWRQYNYVRSRCHIEISRSVCAYVWLEESQAKTKTEIQ